MSDRRAGISRKHFTINETRLAVAPRSLIKLLDLVGARPAKPLPAILPPWTLLSSLRHIYYYNTANGAVDTAAVFLLSLFRSHVHRQLLR